MAKTSQTADKEPAVEAPQSTPDRGGSRLSRLLNIRTFRALQYKNFRYLWLAQISNSAALWIEQVARPILVLDLTGAANTAYMAVNNSLLQTHTEDGFRGRVMSIYLLDRGLVPLGTMIASGLIEVLGPQAGVTIMGSITLLLAVGVALRFKHIRELS